MTSSRVIFGESARNAMFDGMSVVARAVGSTLGPRGRVVLISRPGSRPIATKDGATVAKSIEMSGDHASVGAAMLKEVATRVNIDVGDGTTTATVVSHALCAACVRLLASGVQPCELADSVLSASERIVNSVMSHSRCVGDEDLSRVATAAANDVALGTMVARAIKRVGKDGNVSVELSVGRDASYEEFPGVSIGRGLASQYFVNDQERGRCVLKSPRILIVDDEIISLSDAIDLLQRVRLTGRPLFVIAHAVTSEALQLLVVNKTKGGLDSCAVGFPVYDSGAQRTEALLDLCAATGARLVQSGSSLDSVSLDDLGTCDSVAADQSSSVVIGCDTRATIARSAALRDELGVPGISKSTRLIVSDRLAKLAGSTVVIATGGANEIEARERKDRIEDAVNACKAAMVDGVVAGSSRILALSAWTVSRDIGDGWTDPGVKAVIEACEAPLRMLADNSGMAPDLVIERCKEASHDVWFDAKTRSMRRLDDIGVLDPTRVPIISIKNAAAIARTFVLASAVVLNDAT